MRMTRATAVALVDTGRNCDINGRRIQNLAGPDQHQWRSRLNISEAVSLESVAKHIILRVGLNNMPAQHTCRVRVAN